MASKVVALLEKGQSELRRVLVIGGVTRNAAMLAALREKLPSTDVRRVARESLVRGLGQRLVDARRASVLFAGNRHAG